MKSNKPRKGYLQVPNSVLDELFCKDTIERQRSLLYLCILKHAFFRNGSMKVNKYRYVCQQNEWLTTCSELSQLTGVKRSVVHRLLEQLQEKRYIEMSCNKRFTSIRLTETAPMVRPAEPPVWKSSQSPLFSPTPPTPPQTSPDSEEKSLQMNNLTLEDLTPFIAKGAEQ